MPPRLPSKNSIEGRDRARRRSQRKLRHVERRRRQSRDCCCAEVRRVVALRQSSSQVVDHRRHGGIFVGTGQLRHGQFQFDGKSEPQNNQERNDFSKHQFVRHGERTNERAKLHGVGSLCLQFRRAQRVVSILQRGSVARSICVDRNPFHRFNGVRLLVERHGKFPDMMAELGLGYEHTEYESDRERTNQGVAIPRVYVEKRLVRSCRLSEDLSTTWGSEENTVGHLINSETKFTSPVSQRISLEINLTDHYASLPPGDAKKNDLLLINSIRYSF